MRSFTVRSKYEHAERRGEGDAAVIGAELEAIGEQPGMRHFDIAARDRDRVTITLASAPISMMTVSGSIAAGKGGSLESLFGLRDNQHRVYSAGLNLAPSEYYGAGTVLLVERYTSLSVRGRPIRACSSRTPRATGRPTPRSRARSVIAHAEMLDLAQKFDVTLLPTTTAAAGSIATSQVPSRTRTLPEEAVVPGPRSRRQRSCRRCGASCRAPTSTWSISSRNVGGSACRSGIKSSREGLRSRLRCPLAARSGRGITARVSVPAVHGDDRVGPGGV